MSKAQYIAHTLLIHYRIPVSAPFPLFKWPQCSVRRSHAFSSSRKDLTLVCAFFPTGNWSLLPGGRWHPGGPDDPAQAIRACHCCLQAQHRQVRGRPSADPGISGVWQQTHQLHHGGTGQWQHITFFSVSSQLLHNLLQTWKSILINCSKRLPYMDRGCLSVHLSTSTAHPGWMGAAAHNHRSNHQWDWDPDPDPRCQRH